MLVLHSRRWLGILVQQSALKCSVRVGRLLNGDTNLCLLNSILSWNWAHFKGAYFPFFFRFLLFLFLLCNLYFLGTQTRRLTLLLFLIARLFRSNEGFPEGVSRFLMELLRVN